jgi:hypothetical protein
MPGAPVNVIPTVLVLVVGWRLYGRFRRNIGRQPLQRRRMIFRISIYAVFTVGLGVVSFLLARRLSVFAGLLGGVALGVGLGLYGLHLTRCETTAEGFFYTPNPYMGLGLSLLLVGRLAYRLMVLTHTGVESPVTPQLMQSPLTLFIFGLLAGYYMAYFTGILRRSREKPKASN